MATLEVSLMFWRMNRMSFTEVMQRFLRFGTNSRKFAHVSVSNAVKTVFAKKSNVHIFIDCVLGLIQEQTHIINAHRSDLANAVKQVYETKWGEGQTKLLPTSEVSAYINMLGCEACDWQNLKKDSLDLIQDETLDERVFYLFMNNIAGLSFDECKPIDQCFRDTHERQSLKIRSKEYKNTAKDDLWLQTLSGDYNHQQYLKWRLRSQNVMSSDDDSTDVDMNSSSESEAESEKVKKRKRKKIEDRKSKNVALAEWKKSTPKNLKSKYKSKFGRGEKLCGVFHMAVKSFKCETKDGKCKKGQYARSHKCVCGKVHSMHGCKRIWK